MGSKWSIVGTGDFNQDGRPDLLWQSSDGYLFVWLMDGTNFLAGTYVLNGKTIGANWKVVGLCDLNRDGQVDLVLEHATGYVAAQFLDQTNSLGRIFLCNGLPINPAWRIVAPK